MNSPKENPVTRKGIAIRLFYTIFFFIVFEIIKLILQVTLLFQYVYLFITSKYSEPLREFSNKLSVYAYRIMRYVTLNENGRPFPFDKLPEAMEEAESEVTF